jgi:hypothetical protein
LLYEGRSWKGRDIIFPSSSSQCPGLEICSFDALCSLLHLEPNADVRVIEVVVEMDVPQRPSFWTAYGTAIIAVALIELVAALV